MWKQPIAVSPWNETQEGQSNADWAQGFIDIWPGRLPILLGGSYALPIEYVPDWPNTDYLITTAYNQTVKDAVKVYSGHLYALSNGTTLAGEMNHVRTVEDVSNFVEKIATAKSVGKGYILGKLHPSFLAMSFSRFHILISGPSRRDLFHGLDEEMDATFGSALVTLHRTLRSVSIGLEQLFYHQGTINQGKLALTPVQFMISYC